MQPLLWQQSQVQPGTELGKNGVAALAIDSMPMLVMAGDSVSGSNFENCIRSATQAAELVVEAVGREQAASVILIKEHSSQFIAPLEIRIRLHNT